MPPRPPGRCPRRRSAHRARRPPRRRPGGPGTSGVKQPWPSRASRTSTGSSSRWSASSVGGRGPTEAGREVALRLGDALLQLLDAARRAHHPALVAEVAANLPAHRRHAERQEVVPGARVEPPGGLGQRQVGHLLEVFGGDAAGAVAGHDRVGDRHVHRRELVGQRKTRRPRPGSPPGGRRARPCVRSVRGGRCARSRGGRVGTGQQSRGEGFIDSPAAVELPGTGSDEPPAVFSSGRQPE